MLHISQVVGNGKMSLGGAGASFPWVMSSIVVCGPSWMGPAASIMGPLQIASLLGHGLLVAQHQEWRPLPPPLSVCFKAGQPLWHVLQLSL